VLVGLGIRELSMSAVSIPEVKDAVRKMSVVDTEDLVKRVRTVSTSAEVRAIVSAYMFGISTPLSGRTPSGTIIPPRRDGT
jgi:phosphoenolpyruvate-protein kinase (PTS system EI component)